MELRELRSFCAAARLQSVSLAAQSLGIGQPTVTAHVKTLEGEIGRPLFNRTKRPIRLTPAGVLLAQMAWPLIDQIEALTHQVVENDDQRPVTVASTYSVTEYILPEVVKDFLSRYPCIELRVYGAEVDEILESISNGGVDAAILRRRDTPAHLEYRPLFTYGHFLIAQEEHPLLKSPNVPLGQIASYGWILGPKGTATRTLLEQEFASRGLAPRIVVEVRTMEAIRKHVALGLGVSVIPGTGAIRSEHGRLGIVEVSFLPRQEMGIVTFAHKYIRESVRTFLSTLGESIAKLESTVCPVWSSSF